MKEVLLTQNKIALVDDGDHAFLLNWSWFFNTRYAKTKMYGKSVMMHHVIMGRPPKGLYIDHINGNYLDNRRANLRVVTYAQNNQNARLRSDNRSGFRGVSLKPESGRWVAQLTINKTNNYLGTFATAEEAARAYDAKALEIGGGYVRLNFPVPT